MEAFDGRAAATARASGSASQNPSMTRKRTLRSRSTSRIQTNAKRPFANGTATRSPAASCTRHACELGFVTGARSYVAIDTQGDEYVHVFIDPSIARELATDGVLPFDVA